MKRAFSQKTSGVLSDELDENKDRAKKLSDQIEQTANEIAET